jgi:16S rRNA G1207 methylase RsmC
LGGPFDCVVMNPPFRRGLDVQHVTHARQFLKPGGLLISLCYNGMVQAKGLRPIASTWEVLPSGSFKSEGTAAETVLLTLSA